MVSGSLKLTCNILTGYYSSLAFGSVMSLFGIKGAFFAFFSKTTRRVYTKIFFRV